jgi:hypothetical protein
MTITFENDNDVIVYALEMIVSFAKENQFFFVANCAWWIASIIGLDQGLIQYIDKLQKREDTAIIGDCLGRIHPDRAKQISSEKAISSKPRDLTEDQRLARSTSPRTRVKPLTQTKRQIKNARTVKRLQEARNRRGVKRN